MAEVNRGELDTPTTGQKRKLIRIDGDAVGAFAEKVARFFGTGEYLFWQTVFVVAWVALNAFAWRWQWDKYPFILLNLAFSTQAAYAAPLILLAQNRQEDRDRVQIAEDRRRSEQTKADTEFLARELAGVRLALGENVTRDFLRHELSDLTDLIERIEAKIDDEHVAHRAALEHDIDHSLEKPRHASDDQTASFESGTAHAGQHRYLDHVEDSEQIMSEILDEPADAD